MRFASHPETRWSKKAAKWNPGLSIGCKASRAVGRPRKRWEDDINQFLKPEETRNQEKGFEEQRNMDTGSKRQKTDGNKWKMIHKEQVRKVLKFFETRRTPPSDDISSSPSAYKMAITTSDGVVADYGHDELKPVN